MLDILASIGWSIMDTGIFFLIYMVEAMLLHCFYDEAVAVKKKRVIIVIVSTLSVIVLGVASKYIAKLFLTEEQFDQAMESVPQTLSYALTYILIFIIILCMVVYKGAGIKKTVLRILVATFVYLMLMFNVTIVSAIAFFCVTETSRLTAEINDLSDLEAFFNDLINFVSMLLMMLYLYFNYYKKGFAVRPRKIDRVFVVLYMIFIYVLLVLFATIEAEPDTISLSVKEPVVRVILGLAILVLTTAVPIVMIRGRVNAYYKELNAYQQSFLETELNASKQYKAAQEDTRAFRHDVQNNLSVVAMLMEQGKIEEAQQYLNDMRTEVNALSPKVVTGDEMIDSIVSSKLTKMEEMGIKFDLDGVIDGGLNWKPMDICTVFANLIDNAIEASSKTEEPFINIELKKTDHHRLVRASNSCIEDVDTDKLMSGEAHVTTKENKNLHGYGVGNIRKTVEKYGGMMKLSCKDKVFTMELILKK